MSDVIFIMFGVIFYTLFGGAGGMLVLRLVLWPAFRIAGAPRKKQGRLILGCLLMSLYWVFATAASLAFDLYVPEEVIGWKAASTVSAVSAQALYTLAGWLAGLTGERAAPLPKLQRNATIAGACVGSFFLATHLIDAFAPDYDTGVLNLLSAVAWFVLPVGAVYLSAGAQRRLLSRYRRGACVLCDYAEVGRHKRCTECGGGTQHLCHRCRHIVDARPGQLCPECKAMIAVTCWKCGYDWRGIGSNRCPECGVWKPVLLVEPAPNPASPPASLY